MYDIKTWKKIGRHVYETEGKVIIFKTPFLASADTMLLGGAILLGGMVSASVFLLNGFQEWFLWAVFCVEEIIGLFFVGLSLRNASIRQKHNGVHPKDSLYIFDVEKGELTRYTKGVQERLAAIGEVTFSVTRDNTGKTTRYESIITWPTGSQVILSELTHAAASAALNNIRIHLNLPTLEY